MVKYKLSNKAVDDLTRIWNYTFDKWSENQADKYYLILNNKPARPQLHVVPNEVET